MPKKFSRRLPIVIGAILLATSCSRETNAPAPTSDRYVVERVSLGDVRDIIPAVGPLRAATEVEVGAEVSGRILEVHADFNDPVEVGQLLARIDPAPFESALAQSQAQLNVALAAVTDARSELAAAREERDRLARLVQRGAGRQAELTDIEFRIQSLQARLQSARGGAELAESRVQQAEIDLARTEIRSPVDGFILDRRIEQGQAVNAVQSAPTLFVVTSDLELMFIEAAVSEADIGRIEEDMEVRFKVDAFPRRSFFGEIVEIRRAPIREGRFVSYAVIVETENPVGMLMPGMTASVEFVRSDTRQALRIPLTALYFRPEDYNEAPTPEQIAERIRLLGPLPEDPEIREAVLTGIAIGHRLREGLRLAFVRNAEDEYEVRRIRLGGEGQMHVEVVEGIELGEQVIIDEAR